MKYIFQGCFATVIMIIPLPTERPLKHVNGKVINTMYQVTSQAEDESVIGN